MKYVAEIREKDLPLLAQSYMRTFNSEPWFERWLQRDAQKRLQDLYQSPNFYGLLLWEGNTLLGAVLGRIEHFYDGDTFQIEEFWIERRFQDMGFGSALMQKVRKRLSGTVRSIYLITMHNPKTIRFYQKNGFVMNEGFCILHLQTEEKS